MMPKVVVLIGPSGAGKSSVAKILCDTYGFQLERTVTTRPQRDAFDTDHIFVNEEIFAHMAQSKLFFGVLTIFGHSYGLPRFNPDKPTVLLLRAPAIKQFLTQFPDAIIIEIDAPLATLKQRLATRGSFDRYVPDELQKEMLLGQSLSHYSIDSSTRSAAGIAEVIVRDIVRI